MIRFTLLLTLLTLLLAACQAPALTLDAQARIATAVYAGLTESAAAALGNTPSPATPGPNPADGTGKPTAPAALPTVVETPPQGASKEPPASPTSPAIATLVPPSPTATPAAFTPEQVVMAYLEAYPDGEATMLAALTPARRTALPRGGAAALLLVQGDLEGFSILSGSEIPDPPQALVVVALRAGGQDAVRNFSLLRLENQWLIDSIYK